MFWVVQSNLYREYGYNALMESLVRMNIPHVVVKASPDDVDVVLPADFDTFTYKGNIEDAPQEHVDDSGLVMVMGTISLARIGKKRGWVPGSFMNENFDFPVWVEHWGDHLLNFTSKIGPLGTIEPPAGCKEFFLRPCEDTKAFSGTIMDVEGFVSWRDGMLALENELWHLDGNTRIMMSPLKHIYGEYRFFVVDGKLVTWSRYKQGSRVVYVADVDEEVIFFARQMVNIWQPARAFVLDIASTPDGFKIVEINNFNSAGFYACDVAKIVDAVERMKF